MTGSMKALTSFELEAIRRQEVLLADAPSGRSSGTASTGVGHAARRVAGRLGAAAGAAVALLAAGGSQATGSPRT